MLLLNNSCVLPPGKIMAYDYVCNAKTQSQPDYSVQLTQSSQSWSPKLDNIAWNDILLKIGFSKYD